MIRFDPRGHERHAHPTSHTRRVVSASQEASRRTVGAGVKTQYIIPVPSGGQRFFHDENGRYDHGGVHVQEVRDVDRQHDVR